jgi:hypothetical protein
MFGRLEAVFKEFRAVKGEGALNMAVNVYAHLGSVTEDEGGNASPS